MKKLRKIVITTATVLIIAAMSIFASACNDKEYTITFETDGGTPISAITAKAGEHIIPPSAPKKENYIFRGWYLDADFSGESVLIVDVMPNNNVTYYAKFELDPAATRGITYEYNSTAARTGNVEPSKALPGEQLTVKDGADYGAVGQKFVGWTTTPDGTVRFTGGKNDGQYDAGETYTVSDENITLYAQWAVGYAQADGDDIIYAYAPLFGKGSGAVIRDADGQTKYGFYNPEESDEFTFYYDDGEVVGKLAEKTKTFVYRDETSGTLICYDHAYKEYIEYVLVSDGYGTAMLCTFAGSQIKPLYYGGYAYDKTYSDYEFIADGGAEGFRFIVIPGKPNIDGMTEDNLLTGTFVMQGLEGQYQYLVYDNGRLGNYKLVLNGYGYAHVYEYDENNDNGKIAGMGAYTATAEYYDYAGEWQYTPDTGDMPAFKFVLTELEDVTGKYVPVYIARNEKYSGELTCAADGSTLYMDGYGGAEYTVGGDTYEGLFTVSNADTLITFYPYDENDGAALSGPMCFDVDFVAKTFAVNATGFVIDGDALVAYRGTSAVIVIPDGIKTVNANAFNYQSDNVQVSVKSVVIPASVTEIGARAFENNYTLSRVTFLSATPIAVDWSSANDPFRWGTGNLTIVVPEGSQAAYISAWSDCPYPIKGSVEVTKLPEFEIDENGVLVRYNKPNDESFTGEVKIPDEVTEIADNVFAGLDYITSVDLNNVTKVGVTAFANCYNLKSVAFTSVTELGDGAFLGCESLGLDADGEKSATVALPAIVKIGASAFANCYGLHLVQLGEMLEEICDMAFTECQVYYGEEPLFVELLGSNVPQMGEKIAIGNIMFRIKVKDVTVALDCMKGEKGWNSYCRHLYIDSGDEKGTYMSGATALVIDGRAVLDGSMTFMYDISDDVITMYYYDEQTGSVTRFPGEIANGVITIEIGGTEYRFERVEGEKTYASDDGLYTLICSPMVFDPEYLFEQTGSYSGTVDVLFNGAYAKLYISGYNTKVIQSFRDADGKCYDFAITLDGDGFTYIKTRNEYISGLTADDGSTLTIHITATNIYVEGELKIEVADGVYLPAWTEAVSGTTATCEGNVYTFTRQYRSEATYTITVTVDEDNKTFTYSYTKNQL